MTMVSESAGKAGNPFTSALGLSGLAWILLLAAGLRVFGISLIPAALGLGASALMWITFRYPVGSLGVVLVWMPIHPLAFLVAAFFGPSYLRSFEGCDRVALLLLALILWRRNGVRMVAPDWILLVCFGLAVVRLAFGGLLLNLLADFGFMIAYAAGRLTTLTESQERRWARRAVWIVAVLSVLGMGEVFILGAIPRGILYASVADGFTPDGVLDARFFTVSTGLLRECSTMVSPPFFALLCMAALVIWWVYCRNPLPAAMIAAGLICSVTRSAWLGSAAAIALLAVMMSQKRRFFLYAALAIALFIASVPLLGLGDYLTSTKTMDEPSAQGHQESLITGAEYVASHPFGAGPGNLDRPRGAKHLADDPDSAPFIENSYLMLASEYGALAGLLFVGFVLAALWLVRRERMPRGYAAVGILVGFGGAMMVAPLHQDFALACWIWFPVGLAVRFSTNLEGGARGT